MSNNIKSGVVLFTRDHRKLARFYEAVTQLSVTLSDDQITILESEVFQLVIHYIPGAHATSESPQIREDSHVKPFFPVNSIAEIRDQIAALGGKIHPHKSEWTARGFRACDAVDPDGNVIQFRQPEPLSDRLE